MSRHSKWAKIKRDKAVTDSKRGKVFTKHAKLIEIAARAGGDPEMNPNLRAAIDNARADNLPMDNIERAIKKGTGEGKDSAQIEEVIYEGFAPGGVALLIQTLTDNRNRTITNLKIIMGKKGGTMGASGSVNYLFEKRGLIIVPVENKSADDLELAAIDSGAIDVRRSDDYIEVFTSPNELMQVNSKLQQAGINSESRELIFHPLSDVLITDEQTADSVETLMEALEEDEDVVEIFTNYSSNL